MQAVRSRLPALPLPCYDGLQSNASSAKGPAVKHEKLVWTILVLAPLAIGLGILALLPPGVHQIPIHWDFSGNITDYGSPAALLGLGIVMTGTNALMALCYYRSDQMFDAGLVHGVSKANAPKVLLGTTVFIAVLTAGIYAAILSTVL